jgi:hypothetical protein
MPEGFLTKFACFSLVLANLHRETMNNSSSKLNLSFSQLFSTPTVPLAGFVKIPSVVSVKYPCALDDEPGVVIKEEWPSKRRTGTASKPSRKSCQPHRKLASGELSNSDMSESTPTTMSPDSSASSVAYETRDLIGDGKNRLQHFQQTKKSCDKIREQLRRAGKATVLIDASEQLSAHHSKAQRRRSQGDEFVKTQTLARSIKTPVTLKATRHLRNQVSSIRSLVEVEQCGGPSTPLRRNISERRNHNGKSKSGNPPSTMEKRQHHSSSGPITCPASMDGTNTAETWTCNCGIVLRDRMNFCGMCGCKKHWTCQECFFKENLNMFRYCGDCGVHK